MGWGQGTCRTAVSIPVTFMVVLRTREHATFGAPEGPRVGLAFGHGDLPRTLRLRARLHGSPPAIPTRPPQAACEPPRRRARGGGRPGAGWHSREHLLSRRRPRRAGPPARRERVQPRRTLHGQSLPRLRRFRRAA